jgi:hypothetical protein
MSEWHGTQQDIGHGVALKKDMSKILCLLSYEKTAPHALGGRKLSVKRQ